MSQTEEDEDNIPRLSSMDPSVVFTQLSNPETKAESSDYPAPSNVSCWSDRSKDPPMEFHRHESTTQSKAESSDSPAPSCVSFRSDMSKKLPLNFKDTEQSEDSFTQEQQKQLDELKKDEDLCSVFEAVEKVVHEFVSSELKRFQKTVTSDCFEVNSADGEQLDEWKKPREAVLDLTLHVLRQMKQDQLADTLMNRLLAPMSQSQLKSNLKTKFQSVAEGIKKKEESGFFSEIYTELYLTEEGLLGFHKEHEINQIEIRKPARTPTTLKCEDIFKPSPGREQSIRTVLTKGVAGIGKTVLTQKFSLDWAEGQTNQDIHFIFPFTFRELNLLKEETISLFELVGSFFVETNQGIFRFEEFRSVFIFDGLDECRLKLDFTKSQSVTDVREKTSVDVLLVSLIRGTLLPSAHIWITSRPAVANQIPAEFVNQVTDVRGFTDPQKEIYFRKKFRAEEGASKVISHVKASRSVHNMCYIPVFCWITAKVFDNVLQTRDGRPPQTLTELYIHFLVVQAKITNVKYKGKSEADLHWNPESRKMIMSLSKLAFEQLQKGNMIFYESDLTNCGINIEEASVYSGVFTQMFQEESGLYRNKVFSFVHLTVQEFLAALHVHITFIVSGVNLVSDKQSFLSKIFSSKSYLIQFYQTAVDKALESPNGHLDLFLRFLLGLSLESNQSLLRGLVRQTGCPQINQETAQYLKTKLDGSLPVERNLTLLHCLNELKDRGLFEQVQAWLSSKSLPSDLSPAQWSALVCILLPSEEEREFDLHQYQCSEIALLMLMPVVKASTKALLSGCGLSDRSCEALASVLSSQCSLRELDLSNNHLQESGLNLLCEGLKSPSCALKTISLNLCGLSEVCCESLASVLGSETNSLMELDLSNNDIKDSGIKALCTGLRSPHCKLETLRLSGCQVTKNGCLSLVSALSSGSSCLKELDLSYNHPGEAEVKQLTALSENSQKRLETLRLDNGGVERIQHGFLKYSCHPTLDLYTANKKIKLSNNKKTITVEREKQSYPDHSQRFDYWKQILCAEGLRGRRYWEVEWTGEVYIAVAYKSIKRRGTGGESGLGMNPQSWSLGCTKEKYSVLHKNRIESFRIRPSNRVGVYLDWDNGVLSFFQVSSDQKIHLHTFKTRFTEEVYPAFRVKAGPLDASVTLCTVLSD